jgi:hypothetical protein
MDIDCISDLKVEICGQNNLPSQNITGRFSGTYKGIPWKVVLKNKKDDTQKQVFFYSRFFSRFLAKRIVTLPYLKHKCIKAGRLLLPGTVFSYGNKIFLLFGYSGAGKTKMLLKALEKGAKYVGDERMILSPSSAPIDCSSVIALGYATVRGTKFWTKLPIEKKIQLGLYHFIFLLSKKYIKFNVYLSPKQLHFKKEDNLGGKKLIFINFKKKAQQKYRMSLPESVSAIFEKEEWHKRLYGDIFSLSDQREKIKATVAAIFEKSSWWRVSVDTTLDDILNLE